MFVGEGTIVGEMEEVGNVDDYGVSYLVRLNGWMKIYGM
jgi:hypothetical protein